ncbi:type II toxin-antitoxin system RelE/ParE family toxin [Streptomyces sp. NBC_00370]
MRYRIEWRQVATKAAERFMTEDPAGFLQVYESLFLLADEPRPQGSTSFGSWDVRRIHIGLYRVLYEIEDATITIAVIHVGRVP